MNQPAYTYPVETLILSDSSWTKLHDCPRKFELYKMIGHGDHQFEDNLHTGSGKALHAGWQEWMTSRNRKQAIWQFMKRYPAALCKSGMQVKSMEACYSALEAMMQNKFFESRFELAYINTPFHNTPQPAVEVPFRITFAGVSALSTRHVPIVWDGYIDAILWDTLNHRFVVVDVKTLGRDLPDYSIQFSRDSQCIPYSFILEKATGQTANMLDVIYFVVYIDALAARALPYEFHKTQVDIDEWAFDVANDIRNIKMMADIQYFTKRGKSCFGFSPCVYHRVCDYKAKKDLEETMADIWGKADHSARSERMKPWFELSVEIAGI